MLVSLRDIIQDVATAPNWRAALKTVVSKVQDQLKVDACSLYILDDEQQQYILMATAGLNQSSVGQAHLPYGHGLVGHVAQREEPIQSKNAPAHPTYVEVKGIGEETFKSFLGVPIIHQAKVLGVLVVQAKHTHGFNEDTEAFLFTLSAQLSAQLVHAELAERLETSATSTHHFHGFAAAQGVAMGQAVYVTQCDALEHVPVRSCSDVESEIALFKDALDNARDEVSSLGERLKSVLPRSDLHLFDAYANIIAGSTLSEEVADVIRTQHVWAPSALKQVIEGYLALFSQIEDPYFRERGSDLRDLALRILKHVQKHRHFSADYPLDTILVGDVITAAMIAEVPRERLKAIVAKEGGPTSHTAIVAKALEIPALLGVLDCPFERLDNKPLIVDGYQGNLIVNPSITAKQEYKKLIHYEQRADADFAKALKLESKTMDGRPISVMLNSGLVHDEALHTLPHDGVGLFRTELAFLSRQQFPSEEEQVRVYLELLQACPNKPVVIRTLDIGGDKCLPYFPIDERNAYMGWRGIRIALDHPELLLVQYRALLRASKQAKNLKILLPMITCIDDIVRCKQLLERAYQEVLDEEALDQTALPLPLLGMMIEVPSTIYQIPEYARYVDFVAVGTNDLTQYFLAVDRSNPHVAHYYDFCHPALLRLIRFTLRQADDVRLPLHICGEMTADPVAVLLMIGMGISDFSINPYFMARFRWLVTHVDYAQLKPLAKHWIKLECAREIREQVEAWMKQEGLSKLLHQIAIST